MTSATIAAPQGQDVVISRVVFEGGGATVTLRGANLGVFNFADPMLLCRNSVTANCVDVSGLDDDGAVDALTVGEEETIFVPGVAPGGGELALISGVPTDNNEFLFAYVTWGTFTSAPPAVGTGDAGTPGSLETRADDSNLWVFGESIVVDAGDDTIFGQGDTEIADGYDSCSSD